MFRGKFSKSSPLVYLLYPVYLIVITITEAPILLMCPLDNMLPYALYKQNIFQSWAFSLAGNYIHSKYIKLSFLRQTLS